MTNKPIIRIHDLSNDEILDREMTDDEFAQYLKDKENEEIKAKEKLFLANKKSILLEKLGITEEDAKLLLS